MFGACVELYQGYESEVLVAERGSPLQILHPESEIPNCHGDHTGLCGPWHRQATPQSHN